MKDGYTNLFKKAIASFIVIVMVFYYVPNIVIAFEKTEELVIQEETSTAGETNENTSDVNTKVVGEIVEKRGLTEKHFLLENGNTVATIYPSNVHYKENGKFIDIDNTLQEKFDTKETFRIKEEKQEEVLTEEKLSMKEKQLETIELTKETKIYENESNSFKVNFTNKTKGYSLGSITSKGYSMTWGLRNSRSSEIDVNNPIENTEIKNAKSVNEIEINKATSGIEYKNVLSNIDLNYIVGGEYLKESIILNNKEAISNEIIFEYNTNGLKMKITKEKDIIVYDGKEENVVYTIEAPFMYDSKLEFSSNIEMKLAEENGKYILTLIPNKEWLEAKERVYPITIDPTVYTSLYAADIFDTFIYKGDTNNTGRGGAHILRAGSR